MAAITSEPPNIGLSNVTTSEQDALQASTFQRLYPRVYLERFLSEGYRPDGRTPDAFRDITVNVGSITTADGSALVRLGDTTVVCGVKAEIAEPELDLPTHGFLVPNIDLPALCSPKFKPGPPSDEAQVLSDRLNDVLVSSGVLDVTTLCIHPEKAAWVLYVDATCINYDGNVFDAALVAMVAALRNTRLPKATYDEDTGRTVCSRMVKTPLTLGNLPASFTFGTFDSRILSDPTAFEEPLLTTTTSIVLTEDGSLLSVNQLGVEGDSYGDSVGVKDLAQKCIAAAQERCHTVHKQLYAA